MREKTSIRTLLKNLIEQAKAFLREEIRLVEKELGEKIAKKAKDSARIALGGLLSYASLIAFLAGLGVLLSYLFQRLGVEIAMATFLGLAIVGSLTMLTGGALVWTGIQAIKMELILPEKSIETLKQTGTPDEIEQHAQEVGDRMQDTVGELEDRITLKRFRQQARMALRAHPYLWSGLVISGVVVSILFGRKRPESASAGRV